MEKRRMPEAEIDGLARYARGCRADGANAACLRMTGRQIADKF
jgi:hypothetical protein